MRISQRLQALPPHILNSCDMKDQKGSVSLPLHPHSSAPAACGSSLGELPCSLPHPAPGGPVLSVSGRIDKSSLLAPPAVMPRISPLPAVLYPRQLFNFLLQFVSKSPRSNGDQWLNQFHLGLKMTCECHFLGRYFRLPFRSNPYYFLHGVAPFFFVLPNLNLIGSHSNFSTNFCTHSARYSILTRLLHLIQIHYVDTQRGGSGEN
jgi:hypothetical protein